MRAAGIIVEYNPLHNGHIYHIKETREITGCNVVVAAMSGNFVQRGEPAFVDKFSRTKMALLSGVDLVLELPLVYSISSAEGFAFGGVSLLNSTGIIDSICFGSECGSLEQLECAADILSREPDEFKSRLKYNLSLGMSFPSARARALACVGEEKKYPLDSHLFQSNNILSIEYLKALMKLNSTIKPYTIKRIGSAYDYCHLQKDISSATAIRNNFSDPSVASSLPDYVYDIIQKLSQEGRGPVTLSDLSDMIILILRQKSIEEIAQLMDVSEGLEYKIKRAAQDCGNIYELINTLKCKRYTSTRIQRILLYSLFNIKKDILPLIKSGPSYIRVLGFNTEGRKALSLLKNTTNLPVITNPSPKDQEFMKYDLMATDIYTLLYKNTDYKNARMDYKMPPVMI